MVKRESCPSKIGPINLGTKQTGAPSAGNPHAGCDVAGAGNGFTVWLLRHSQRKRGATAKLNLPNTAPVLDPTGFSTSIDHLLLARFSVPIWWDFPQPDWGAWALPRGSGVSDQIRILLLAIC